MPRYSFECVPCELKFERTLRVGEHKNHACPLCSQAAPLVMSGFGFAFGVGSGSLANTGVHTDDYPTADVAVGRSADERWAHIHKREKVKKEAREKGGTKALIRRAGDGYIDYEPMSEHGEKARSRLNQDARKVLKRE